MYHLKNVSTLSLRQMLWNGTGEGWRRGITTWAQKSQAGNSFSCWADFSIILPRCFLLFLTIYNYWWFQNALKELGAKGQEPSPFPETRALSCCAGNPVMLPSMGRAGCLEWPQAPKTKSDAVHAPLHCQNTSLCSSHWAFPLLAGAGKSPLRKKKTNLKLLPTWAAAGKTQNPQKPTKQTKRR